MLSCAQRNANKAGVLKYIDRLFAELPKLSSIDVLIVFDAYLDIQEIEKAKKTLERAELQEKNESLKAYMHAKLVFAQNKFKQALALLSDLNLSGLPSWFILTDFYQLKAKVHEKLNDFEDAFQCFTKVSEVTQKLVGPQSDIFAAHEKLDLKKLANQSTGLKGSNTKHLPEIIFIAGFPRSGTTLLDSYLSADERLTVLSETGALRAAISEMENVIGLQYPSQLHKLSKSNIELMREAYLEFVQDFLGFQPKGIVIDKQPTATLHMPLINILFPDVKVIFPVRHPLDVIVSCFQQNFQLNAEMAKLITLKDCFESYERIMGLYNNANSELGFAQKIVKYEDLIEAPKSQLDQIYQFIGFEGCPFESPDHKTVLKDKFVNTATRYQIGRGLNKTSQGKWKDYAQWIEEDIVTVAPFIEKFGYTL